MKSFCKHHYVYTQGYFYCTKCGNRNYGRTYKRKKNVKIGLITAGVIIAGVILFIYTNPSFLSSNIAQNTIQTASNTISETTKQLELQLDKVKKIPSEIKVEEMSNPTQAFKPEFSTSNIENLIHQYTNEERSKRGIAILSDDSKLDSIARSHSKDMAQNNYFSHYSRDGKDPTDRGMSGGYPCRKVSTYGLAENIAQNWLYTSYMTSGVYTSYNWNTEESLAKDIVGGWMSSPGHRENILTRTYDRLGVGIAIAKNDAVYATQNFC